MRSEIFHTREQTTYLNYIYKSTDQNNLIAARTCSLPGWRCEENHILNSLIIIATSSNFGSYVFVFMLFLVTLLACRTKHSSYVYKLLIKSCASNTNEILTLEKYII